MVLNAFWYDETNTVVEYALSVYITFNWANLSLFDNVFAYWPADMTYCNTMGWWYDTLGVNVDVSLTLPYGLFSSYDYATEDDGALVPVKTRPGFLWGAENGNTADYVLDSVYNRVFGPSLGGYYGVNTCDADQEESLNTETYAYSPDEPIETIDEAVEDEVVLVEN